MNSYSNIIYINLKEDDNITTLKNKIINLYNIQQLSSGFFFNKQPTFEKLFNHIAKQTNELSFLIINNLHYLNQESKSVKELYDLIRKNYNKEDKNCNLIILSDWFKLDGLIENYTVGSLLTVRPFQYGLRGDIPLWEKLLKYCMDIDFPANQTELATIISDAIISITGKNIDTDFFVKN